MFGAIHITSFNMFPRPNGFGRQRMSLTATLSGEAVELFECEWQCERNRVRVQRGQINCPLHWLMPELLRLAQEFNHAPIDQMRPLVYRLVLEFDFANQTGVHDETEELIALYVDTLVRVIDQVRTEARDRGQWLATPAPATPPVEHLQF